jgi:enterobactin synthetase component D
VVNLNEDVLTIEGALKSWFSEQAFIKASKIELFPILEAEMALVENAVVSRQKEFSTGRWLAHQGLSEFGCSRQPIEIGKLRNPLWPDSVLGTITHDGDCCAVVLVQKQFFDGLGIGIDLVALSRLDQLIGLEALIVADASELEAVAKLNLALDPLLLLFSIKESVIKALSFYLDDFVDMRAIEVQFADKMMFKLSGRAILGDVFATATRNYLLTAIRICEIEAWSS